MIARIVFIQIKPGMKDEEEKFWNTEIVPVLIKQKGFSKAYKMMEANSNEGVVVEFWDTKEDEEAWRNSEEHKESGRNILTTVNELGLNRPFELVQEINAQV